MPGLCVEPIRAKSALNRVNAPSMPFLWSLNPYRSCSHSCPYCYARAYHEWLELDAGADFDTRILVKENLPELLSRELARPSWRGELVAIGTAVDPYQPAEGKYRLTRGVVEVLVERSNPFSILTKSTLALRDLELFVEAAQRTDVSVNFSIGTLDPEVWKTTEPGTPHPQRRIEAVAKLTDAGVPSSVLVAPLLPGLSDRPDQIAAVERACREAGAHSVSRIRLHLRPGVKQHFMGWLALKRPDLVPEYERLYHDRAYLSSPRRRRSPYRQQPKPPEPKPVQTSLPFA